MRIRKRDAKDIVDYDHASGKISLSDLVCVRRALWGSKMTLKDIIEMEKDIKLSMEFGSIVHRNVNLKWECEKEVRIDFCNRRFRADYVCDNGEKVVVEVKTSVGKYMLSTAVWQLTGYMAMMNIKKGYLISLRDSTMYEVEITDEEIEKIKDEICKRIEMVEKNIDVPIRGPWCEKCIFKRKCYNNTLDAFQ